MPAQASGLGKEPSPPASPERARLPTARDPGPSARDGLGENLVSPFQGSRIHFDPNPGLRSPPASALPSLPLGPPGCLDGRLCRFAPFSDPGWHVTAFQASPATDGFQGLPPIDSYNSTCV